tara:strand:- start:415 stop:2064 length:1650 start_codon:yes stop_codon:yes gene_type:complete
MQNAETKVIKYKNKKLGVINFLTKNKGIILPFIFILSYSLLYFLVDPSSQSLVAHDEGLYARRARLVEESFNWFSSPFVSPHHKTIGSYWFIALSIRIFGKSELALRLPSILASFLCLFILYFIALKISNKKSALISVLSLSSMPLWVQYSRYSSPDVLFVLFIFLFILFFLNFIESNHTNNKYIYIFSSGLFISSAFFIRSYMVFVPFIGLTPFICFHLARIKKIFIFIFISGIFFGSFPTFLNLYFSYKKFGIEAITSLFDFAKKQAIGGLDLNNFLFIPLNYIYLTFPVGILIIFLFAFTRSNINIKYPLLIYYFPLISLSILLVMSTSYPHYFLFLLPSLSILFAVKLQSYTFKSLQAKKLFKLFLSFIMLFISLIILSLLLFHNYLLDGFSFIQTLLVYLLSSFMILSFIYSLRYLLDIKNKNYHLIKFFNSIIIPQYVSLSLFYNFGLIGNPNYNTKSFINDKHVSSIVNSNTIYLYNVDSKIKTLLSYYLPSSIVIKSLDDIKRLNYLITSDKKLIYEYKNKYVFKSIKNFDNHFLLKNVSQ